MTKAKKAFLLVTLGLLFVLTIAIATVSSTAIAATAEDDTDYYFKIDGKVVQNNTVQLKRGQTTGEITFYQGEQQLNASFLIMPQTLAEKYLTLNGNTVTAKEDIPLSYTESDRPYILCLGGSGLHYLYFQIIPNDDIELANMGNGPFTFTVRGVKDIATIVNSNNQETTEQVSMTINFTNSVGESTIVTYSITDNVTHLTVKGIPMSGYNISDYIDVVAVSITYSYGSQSITYTVEEYPQLFGKASCDVYTYFVSGDGSSSDPYTIDSAIQLTYIANTARYDGRVSDYVITSHFLLLNDINMENSTSLIMMKTITAQFQGTFSGDNHAIYNLQMYERENTADYGIFRHISASGVVKNLWLVNVKMIINNDQPVRLGAIAAFNYGTINNCTVDSGTIVANKYQQSQVGGIAGYNAGGTISYCTNRANVEGCGSVGGIVGENTSSGNVLSCTNRGSVTLDMVMYNGTYYTGYAAGIVGRNTTNASIKKCNNYGTIIYGGPVNSSYTIQPCMAQIVGWLLNGTLEDNHNFGSVDFSKLVDDQAEYCSDKLVGKQGN